MTKWLKTIAWGLALFAAFIVVTFPYERLGSILRTSLETALSRGGLNSQCSLEGLSYQFPLGLAWSRLACSQGSKPLFSWGSGSVITLPGYQKVSTEVGKGSMQIQTNMSLLSAPTSLKAQFQNIPLNISSLSRLLQAQSAKKGMGFGAQPAFMVLNELKVDGLLNGSIDFPLTALHRKSGQISLELKDLKVPEQASLSLVGLPEVIFTKSLIKADLKAGKLTLNDVELSSPQISAKAEGGLEFQEDLPKSVGPLTLKWKITKSEAIANSPLGSQITSRCPNMDSQGFCSLRFQRLHELM